MNTLFKTVTDRHAANNEQQENIISLRHAETIEQTIFIRNLELEMFIGVMDVEKKSKQRVIVDAEISVIPTMNVHETDSIDDVVSYADILEQIKSLAAQQHIHLVESFAEMIIDECFKHQEVLTVSVSIEKPDIIGNGASVGAAITKMRC